MRRFDRHELGVWARSQAINVVRQDRPSSWDSWWGEVCPECGKERPTQDVHGYVCDCDRERGQALEEEFASERREELVAAILERAHIPRRYAACTFDGFTRRKGTEEALKAARVWADGFDLEGECGLLLAGPYGSGKTHLLTAALRLAVERTLVEAQFVGAGDLVAQVRSGERLDWKPVERAIGAELLLLDDLGQEVGTEFTRDVVARVLFGRYEAARPTLMTSNLGPQGLGDLFGGAVVSRIREMAQVATLFATDYRAREKSA